MSETLPVEPQGRGKTFRNLTLLCASSLTVMAGTPVSPALPTMEVVFAGHPSADLLVRLMLTLPGLFIGLLAPASGWLVDRFGRKPLLLWGAVLYTAAGSSGLYLDSLWAILVGRALLGVAVAAIMTAAVTLIGDYFAGAERQRFLGLQAAFMSFGGMIFLLAGGLLSDLSWRGPFGIYLVAIGLVPMVILAIREPQHATARSNQQVQPAVAAVPWGVIALIYAVAFLGMIAFYAIPVQLPFHLRMHFDAKGTDVGIAIACMTFFSTLASMLFYRIKSRLSFQGVIAVMLLGLGIGYLVVATASSYGFVLVGLMVAGSGLGLLMPNLNVWLMSHAPDAIRGRLVGGLTMALFLGQFMSPIVLRPLLASWGTTGLFAGLAGILFIAASGFGGYAGSR